MYKKVFASEGHENITIGLVGDFFNLKPEKLVFRLPYSIESYTELLNGRKIDVLRQRIRDVDATMAGADFIGELQLKKAQKFEERFFLYICDKYRSNYSEADAMEAQRLDFAAKEQERAALKALDPAVETKKSPLALNRYASLKTVYQLVVLGANHYADNYPLRIFEAYDPERGLRPDDLLFKQAYFEIRKDKSLLNTENQMHWSDYFQARPVSKHAPDYVREAAELLRVSNFNRGEREFMVTAERAIADFEADLSDSFQEGLREGHREGHREGRAENARKVAVSMLSDGIPLETIARYTGLDIREIENLKKKAH